MEMELVVETARGAKHMITAEVVNHGNGSKHLETEDGRGFKLYENGKIMEIKKYGLEGNVVAGKKLA